MDGADDSSCAFFANSQKSTSVDVSSEGALVPVCEVAFSSDTIATDLVSCDTTGATVAAAVASAVAAAAAVEGTT